MGQLQARQSRSRDALSLRLQLGQSALDVAPTPLDALRECSRVARSHRKDPFSCGLTSRFVCHKTRSWIIRHVYPDNFSYHNSTIENPNSPFRKRV
ncbi:hypothetical protein [Burkholderia lata]|uniref:hypothetical protein n=1 Tax=Burkholderia lata (strain ATCC 17760 / DSM 23089 / LMG 22485 / NCIMB 9086 / R18194 / 383) TaxID=482957 RepID=UPI001583DEDB|nr:hypothetical protein [Burkholderia lata]